MGRAGQAMETFGGFREIVATGPVDTVDRLPEFIGGSADARSRLGRLRVLVIGVGSVNQRAVEHLARCQIGELGLVDPKPFSANFQTQAIRSAGEIGRAKVVCTGRWARQVSGHTVVRIFQGPIESIPWPALDRYDVLLASTDLIRAEVEIGLRARRLGKKLLMASVHGPSLTAQLRVFLNAGPDSPCPSCGLNAMERDQMNAETRFSCDGGSDPVRRDLAPPTVSIAPLCSLAADMAVLELLRIELGLGPAPADCIRQINGYDLSSVTSPLGASAGCPVDHTILERRSIQGPLSHRTLRECSAAAGVDDPGTAAFNVDDAVYAATLVCSGCGHEHDGGCFVARPIRRRCRECRRVRAQVPHPFRSFAGFIPAASSGLAGRLDVPLGELGAAGHAVTVRGGERAVLVTRDDARGDHP